MKWEAKSVYAIICLALLNSTLSQSHKKWNAIICNCASCARRPPMKWWYNCTSWAFLCVRDIVKCVWVSDRELGSFPSPYWFWELALTYAVFTLCNYSLEQHFKVMRLVTRVRSRDIKWLKNVNYFQYSIKNPHIIKYELHRYIYERILLASSFTSPFTLCTPSLCDT